MRKLTIQWIAAFDLEDTTTKQAPDNHTIAWNSLKVQMAFWFPEDLVTMAAMKILAAKYAQENNVPYLDIQENNVPYLDICLGMHIVVIEFAQTLFPYMCRSTTTL